MTPSFLLVYCSAFVVSLVTITVDATEQVRKEREREREREIRRSRVVAAACWALGMQSTVLCFFLLLMRC